MKSNRNIYNCILLIFFYSIIVGQKNEIMIQTRKLIEKEEYIKPLTLLNDFIKNDTTNFEAYAQRAICLKVIGNYEKAFADLKHSIFLNKYYADSYTTLGTVYAMVGKYDSAIANYNNALLIDSAYAKAFNSRGSVYYYYLNQNDKALDDFTKTISINPKLYKAYYNRAIIYRLMNMPHQAIADLNQSLKLHPKTHMTYNERGLIYMNIGNYKKAISDYKFSIKHNTKMDVYEKLDNGPAYYSIGYCYQELGKTKKSVKYFQLSKDLGYINK